MTENTSRPPFYFSIDFEDIGADMLRFLGIDRTAAAREGILWRTYEEINTFAQQSLGGRPLTFFCTGVLGLYAPDLINRIARDGHEIACHSHFHDAVFKDSPELFDKRLEEAIDALEVASNTAVIGFRAPMFSVLTSHVDHYAMIAKRFRYDSSIIADLDKVFDEGQFAKITRDGALRLFPVPMLRKLGRIEHKTGGTFFKVLPLDWTIEALHTAPRRNVPPIFYMHPYEFTSDGRFRLGWADFAPLGPAKQALWWARQAQWHNVGNGGLVDRLGFLANHFEHQGNMRDLLES
jgi:hypothetical protein